MSTSNKEIVAAIHFGTTYSSYAFSFKSDDKSDPLKVYCNNWKTSGRRNGSNKTLTCVLFNKDKVFDSFGNEAEEKYSELAEEEEHQEWYFFKSFKTSLFNKNEPLLVKIKSTDGKEMMAVDVFSAAIKFLRDNLLEKIEKKVMWETVIQWVLVAPAIWDDAAKQFMSEASEKAGICGDQLLIIPEPKAVFVSCMQIETRMDKNNLSSIGAGTKHMVVIAEDIGVEIVVYDVQHKGVFKKLYKAYYSDWGGNKVYAPLCSLLTDVVGDNVMKAFFCKHEDDFHQFLINFDYRMRSINPKQTDKFTFTIPCTIEDTFTEMNPGCNINTRISSIPKYKNKLSLVGDRLRIDAQIAKAFFDESCRKIIYHMQELFLYPTLKDVSSILLAGSYAKSPMLEFAVREAFKYPYREVFVPQDADLAALKGAVIYGHQQISS